MSVLNPGTGKRHTFSHNAWLQAPDALSARIEDPTGGKQEQDPLAEAPLAAVVPAPAPAAAPPPPPPTQRDAFDDDETSSRIGGSDLFDDHSIRSGVVIGP